MACWSSLRLWRSWPCQQRSSSTSLAAPRRPMQSWNSRKQLQRVHAGMPWKHQTKQVRGLDQCASVDIILSPIVLNPIQCWGCVNFSIPKQAIKSKFVMFCIVDHFMLKRFWRNVDQTSVNQTRSWILLISAQSVQSETCLLCLRRLNNKTPYPRFLNLDIYMPCASEPWKNAGFFRVIIIWKISRV